MKKSMIQFTIIRAACVSVVIALMSCSSTPSSSGSSGGTSSAGTTPTASSASSERKVPGRVPQFVKDALKSAPENALVAIGTAKMATLSLSMTIAETRARAGISRQMDTMVKDMVRDYQAGSEVDQSAALAFQENITVALSQSRLQGASVVELDEDSNGAFWCVVMLTKAGAVQEINQAASAAKLAVPAAASFDAEKRMDAGLAKMNGEEVPVTDKDQ